MNKIIIISSILAVLIIGAAVISLSNSGSNTTAVSFTHMSPQQFNTSLQTGKYTLLDIRTVEEYNTGHVKNAQQIDYYQTEKFSSYLDALDKNKQYLIYCRSGNRTGKALQLMQEKGFTHVNDLEGGIVAWQTAGLSIEK